MRRSIRAALMMAVVTAALSVWGGLPRSAWAVSVTFTGSEQTVFDYTTMACSPDDFPDGPAQAFRNSAGQVVSFSGVVMVGPDFDHLTRDCRDRFPIVYDPNPAHYNYSHGIAGAYTTNGQDIYALVDNEFHGWELPGFCPSGGGGQHCGSGGITFAASHDGGNNFVAPAPPNNFVATVGPRPKIDDRRTGLFAPSDPIKKGSYWYSAALLGAVRDQDAGVCMMRSPDITDPTSWRGWDGTSFSVKFHNPYYENVTPQNTHTCEPVSYDNILSMSRSLTFNTFLNKYVLTGTSVKFDPVQSRNVYGFYFSTSDDLVTWSPRQLLMEIPSLLSHQCGGPDAGAYPSLIDQTSTDPNFRITGANAWLYFVRLHYNSACQLTFDRNLVRDPIQFSP